MTKRSIPRISMPSREAFESDYVLASQPVIIEGGMTRWPALTKWSQEYLATSPVASRVVPIEYYEQGNRYVFPLWDYRPMRDMTLGDYMGIVASDDARRYYLADEEIKTSLPELWADVALPPLFDRQRLAKTGMFVGRDTVDAAHCHPIDQVLVCQVVGKRRIVLFEPDDGALLAPAPWYSPNFNWATLDFDRIDPADEPRLAPRRYECTLAPGEMLLVPVQWWNLMIGAGFNAAVCLIWGAKLREWPSRYSGGRVIAAGLVNNAVVRPILLPWLQRRFAAL